jgi:hypothetical protein
MIVPGRPGLSSAERNSQRPIESPELVTGRPVSKKLPRNSLHNPGIWRPPAPVAQKLWGQPVGDLAKPAAYGAKPIFWLDDEIGYGPK